MVAGFSWGGAAGPRVWPPAPGKLLVLVIGREGTWTGVCGAARGGLPAELALARGLAGGCGMALVTPFG